MTDYQHQSTRAVHGARPPGIRHGPLVTPIVQSTTYLREDVDSPVEHAYSRVSNPTVDALERQLGSLEDAPPAVCFSSGLAAETALFMATLNAGDHVVCGRAIYGGTQRLLQQVLSRFGIETTFVDSARTEENDEASCVGTVTMSTCDDGADCGGLTTSLLPNRPRSSLGSGRA